MHYFFVSGNTLIFFYKSFMRNLEKHIGKWSDTSLLMISFLSSNEVSKIQFANKLPIKETVFDVTLVGLVIRGMQPCAKIYKYLLSLLIAPFSSLWQHVIDNIFEFLISISLVTRLLLPSETETIYIS